MSIWGVGGPRGHMEMRHIDTAGIDVDPLRQALGGEVAATHNEFLERQAQIGDSLVGAGLSHVVPFNEIYTDLSAKVDQVVAEGGFEHPSYVTNNMPVFGEQYHDDLRLWLDHVAGDETALTKMNPAWCQLLMDARVDKTEPWQRLMMGIFTHIRSEDLALSMAITQPGPEYYTDYTKRVHQPITDVIKAEIGSYMPYGRKEPVGLATATAGLIARLRGTAYKNYWSLRNLTGDEAKQRALRNRLNEDTVRYNEVIIRTGSAAVFLSRVLPAKT